MGERRAPAVPWLPSQPSPPWRGSAMTSAGRGLLQVPQIPGRGPPQMPQIRGQGRLEMPQIRGRGIPQLLPHSCGRGPLQVPHGSSRGLLQMPLWSQMSGWGLVHMLLEGGRARPQVPLWSGRQRWREACGSQSRPVWMRSMRLGVTSRPPSSRLLPDPPGASGPKP